MRETLGGTHCPGHAAFFADVSILAPSSQLCDLTVLNVSLNGLEDIPAELGSMSKLESLNMNDNRMKTVPDVVRLPATLCPP